MNILAALSSNTAMKFDLEALPSQTLIKAISFENISSLSVYYIILMVDECDPTKGL